VIRQAISCDICGAEKKQTNHWFVAHDQGGELRISGWTSRNRLRPGSRHLCGQTCLHKLVDDFMAKSIAVRVPQGAADEATVPDIAVASISAAEVPAAGIRAHVRPATEPALARPEVRILQPATSTDTSLIAASVDSEFESEFQSLARLIPAPAPSLTRPSPLRAQPELVPAPARPHLEEPPPADEPPRFASRNWRAEAWDRERERELRSTTRGKEIPVRRRSGS
jgi:hypothetical protein